MTEESIYQLLAGCQKNGRLGNGFHGSNKDAGNYENQEVDVKYLAEKAVGKTTRKNTADKKAQIQKVVASGNRLARRLKKLQTDAVHNRRRHTGYDNVLQLRLSCKRPQAAV